ncbi:hypothetical protein [Streptomyces aculeolatus]|uniref:hypothetical protein n=1 Tax=Streptomyces aculeolatus TaxID=270689 RepID=UPI001CEC5A3C|nr:hypothetical protein [Streptomyces aculeolatus]
MTPGEDGGERILGLVEEHLDSIRAGLTDEEYALLLTRLRALADAPPDDARAVRRAFQGVRLCLLPLAWDHPARAAVDSVRFTGSAAAGPQAVLRSRALLARLAAGPPDPGPGDPRDPPAPGGTPATAGAPDPGRPGPGDPPGPGGPPAPQRAPDTAAIIAAAERRLLRAPALSAAEARARCGGATPPPELIRLAHPDLGERYPEFQFRSGGGPYGVVLEVNRVLLADADPWGAADWWLGANAWLGGGPPAALLGVRPDGDLVDAALALVEAD